MTPQPALLFVDTRLPASQAVPRITAKMMRPVFLDPGCLEVDVPAFIAAYQDWILDMADREPDPRLPKWIETASRDATLVWIQEQGVAGSPVKFNTVWRNKRGFRRHFLHLDAPKGLLVGKCPPTVKYDDGRRGTRWLQNVPKKIRSVGLRAPLGRLLIQADIKSAFPLFMSHAAHDLVLHADLGTGIHDEVARALNITRDKAKIVNNGLIGLMGPERLMKELQKAGLEVSLADATRYHRDWWNRYAASKRLKLALRSCWSGAVTQTPDDVLHGLHPMKIIAPDGSELRYSKAEVAGAKIPNDKAAGFPSMVSAIWQCIEATAMDLAMLKLHQRGAGIDLKLVLGMYDGLLYSAPEEHEDEAARLVKAAIEAVMARIGYPGTAETIVHRYWYSPPPKDSKT